MQLKGLVRFFAIALILICLYQLSFTWFVRSHEKAMDEKAQAWMKRFPTPEQQYPGDKEKQAIYADSLAEVKKERVLRLLDSTKETKLAFGLVTYRSAKESELMLGLDLQGGMSVTMEVGLDGLIKSLSNYTKDANFNKALDAAVARKAVRFERRLELAMEGDRFFDLVRTGQAATKITGFVAGKNEVFPIPQQEIDASGLTQNPNYN